MNAISLKGRSVLGLQDFTAGEIERILEVAAQMKKIVLSDNKKRDFLKGKSIVTVFSEASTRTRSSFELAGKYLGADVINITKSGSSMTKGESMRDTLLTVSAMGVDAVIIRDSSEGAALFASKVMSPKVKVPVVINAGDGAHAHAAFRDAGAARTFHIKGSRQEYQRNEVCHHWRHSPLPRCAK